MILDRDLLAFQFHFQLRTGAFHLESHRQLLLRSGAIAALIFVGVMLNEDYREAIVAIAVIYVVALVGFAAFGRHRLVLSPEEEYAMSGGLHGDPQVEGYGAIDVDAIVPEARSRTT